MPRRPEQYAQLRDATRESIEASAVRLFASHGFAATSMRQIAGGAGLSAGSIYRHYATKEDLFDALLTQATSGLADLASTMRGEGDAGAILRSITELIVSDLAGENGAAQFFMVMNQGFVTDDPPGTAARLAAEHAALRAATADLIARGQRERSLASGDPAQLATLYFATLSGLVTLRAAQPSGTALPSADLVLRPLTGGTHVI